MKRPETSAGGFIPYFIGFGARRGLPEASRLNPENQPIIWPCGCPDQAGANKVRPDALHWCRNDFIIAPLLGE